MSVLLVRVECLCGTIAAIPEGGFFPLCGCCGRRMVPPGPQDARRERGLAYVAELQPERDAARAVSRQYAPGSRYEHADPAEDTQRVRQYTDDDLRESLRLNGYPIEAQEPAEVTR